MTILAKLVSLVALGAVIVPCAAYFAGELSLQAVKQIALIGTIGWFIVTPLWMGRHREIGEAEGGI